MARATAAPARAATEAGGLGRTEAHPDHQTQRPGQCRSIVWAFRRHPATPSGGRDHPADHRPLRRVAGRFSVVRSHPDRSAAGLVEPAFRAGAASRVARRSVRPGLRPANLQPVELVLSTFPAWAAAGMVRDCAGLFPPAPRPRSRCHARYRPPVRATGLCRGDRTRAGRPVVEHRRYRALRVAAADRAAGAGQFAAPAGQALASRVLCRAGRPFSPRRHHPGGAGDEGRERSWCGDPNRGSRDDRPHRTDEPARPGASGPSG